MIDHGGKFDAIYSVMRPKAEAFKRMATEQEVDQPRALVMTALISLAATIIVEREFNEATRTEAARICAEVIERLVDDLFPMVCR